MFDVIAFDADDTLWHNEQLYRATQTKFAELLSPYQEDQTAQQALYLTETRNISYFGYGIKSFTLSMIETAIDLTEGRITGDEIQKIIRFAKEMLQQEVQLLAEVEETLDRLAPDYDLMIITKGDLLDQETKIARSGLADYFDYIEVVSEKTSETYRALLQRYGLDPVRFLMVGNSLKSDVLPVLAVGGQAVYVPYPLTWGYEQVDTAAAAQDGYFELEHLGLLPALLQDLANSPAAGGDGRE
jgi:putative hydrolase of the HAD superfamily